MRSAAPKELEEFDRSGHDADYRRFDIGRHGCDEPVACFGNRLDVHRRPPLIVERLAQGRDMRRQGTFLDEGIWPDGGQQRVLGQQAPRRPHQRQKQFVRLWRESHRQTSAQ